MMSSPTKNVPLLIKVPKISNKGNKPHYEGSEATDTDHYSFEKDTENIKYKEGLSIIEDYDYFLSKI